MGSSTIIQPQPVAVITGLSRRAGIAATVAVEMRRAGWCLGLTGWPTYDAKMEWGRIPSDLHSIMTELEAISPDGVAYVEADLSQPSAPKHVFDEIENALGDAEVLINIHAHSMRGDLLETSTEEFDMHMAVNARGTFLMCAEYARRWRGNHGNGRIVNFTSSLPLKGELAYAASKGAVEWITVVAASELASKGITVNAINPGPNNTGWMSQHLEAEIATGSPLGRVGTPKDIADLVVFLCSPGAKWITGQVLNCDGGWGRLRS